jgi:hypothetical protein
LRRHPGSEPDSLDALGAGAPVDPAIGPDLPAALAYGLLLLSGDVFSLAIALLAAAALWILTETEKRDRVGRSLPRGSLFFRALALPQVVATALVAPGPDA